MARDPNARLREATRAARRLLLADLAGRMDDVGIASRQHARDDAYGWLSCLATLTLLEARGLLLEPRGVLGDHTAAEPRLVGWRGDLTRAVADASTAGATSNAGPWRDPWQLRATLARRLGPLGEPAIPRAGIAPRWRTLADVQALLDAPALAPVWRHEQTLGWIYQHFYEPERDPPRAAGSAKVALDGVAAATRQFTPEWIVAYLAQNTLGQLWLRMHPESWLRARLAYLVPDIDAPLVPLRPVRAIRVLDPACGTMHFGLAAFDLLVAMYREERARAGQPGWPAVASVARADEIAASILRHNLHGVDIDEHALRLAGLALWLRAAALDPRVAPGAARLLRADVLRLADDSAADDHPLPRRRFDVVLANPPYLDSRRFDPALRRAMVARYPAGRRNLYAAFQLRCLALLRRGGRLGMVSPQTFMFLDSFAGVRQSLRAGAAIESLAQAGMGTFADAVVDIAFYVLRAEPSRARREWSHGLYLRLVSAPGAAAKRRMLLGALSRLRAGARNPAAFRWRQADYDALPGAPWVYWLAPAARALLGSQPALGDRAAVVVGLQTGDNFRFLRFWWEVGAARVAFGCADAAQARSSGKRWFPHMKGGALRRWWGNQDYVVNWAADGGEIRALGLESGQLAARPQNQAYYFRGGVTWTHTSARGLSARWLPPGFICNVEAMAAFPRADGAPDGGPAWLLALLNAPLVAALAEAQNATVHFGAREMRALPCPDALTVDGALDALAARAVALARAEAAEDETTYEFIAPPAWPDGARALAARRTELAGIERVLAERVASACGLAAAGHTVPLAEPRGAPSGAPPAAAAITARGARDRSRLAQRWVSYAVGVVLGRFAPAGLSALAREPVSALVVPDGIAPLDPEHPCDLAARVARALTLLLGMAEARAVMAAATSGRPLARALARPFYAEHLRRYRQRPVYWLLESPRGGYRVYLSAARMSRATLALLAGDGYLGGASARRQAALAHDGLGAEARAALARELGEIEALRAAALAAASRPDTRGAAVGWAPEPDDGVLISLAPLAELLPAWYTAPRDCWRALEAGTYDWSRTAMRYWPDRVLAACQGNRSLALAHGLVAAPAGSHAVRAAWRPIRRGPRS